jgi:hypothetical protein
LNHGRRDDKDFNAVDIPGSGKFGSLRYVRVLGTWCYTENGLHAYSGGKDQERALGDWGSVH